MRESLLDADRSLSIHARELWRVPPTGIAAEKFIPVARANGSSSYRLFLLSGFVSLPDFNCFEAFFATGFDVPISITSVLALSV